MAPTTLQRDTVLEGNRAHYRLIRRLGSGKYGEVWQAEVVKGEIWLDVDERDPESVSQVAIKVPHPGLTEEEYRHYWSEVEVLHALQHTEGELGLRIDGYSLVPTVFDAQDQQLPHFFVQTLAAGEPLDELMRDRGALPEREALTIVGQFCRVLEALHTGVRRSYLDFQPGNIFWDEGKARVLVIDWNLLTKRGDLRVQDDVLAAARVLYRALTGVQAPAPGSRRSLAEPLQQWVRLSLYAQDMLTRAFHPNPARRYASADKLRTDVEVLLRYWNQCESDPTGFVQGIGAFIPATAGQRPLVNTDREQVQRAAAMLSIAEKFQLDPALASQVEHLKAQIGTWMTGLGALDNGVRFFEIADYQAALQEFRQAVEEAWDTQTALHATRWIQVASVARDRRYGAMERNTAARGLSLMAEGSFEDAEQALTPLLRPPSDEVLQSVVDEAHSWRLLRESDRAEAMKNFGLAAEKCREAHALLTNLPPEYAALLREELGDLEQRAEELEAQAKVFAETQNRVADIDRAFGSAFSEGWTKLEAEFNPQPNHSALVEVAQKWSAHYLEAGKYNQARAVAALALDYTIEKELRSAVWPRWHVSKGLAEAQTAWKARDWERFREAVKAAHIAEASPQFINQFRAAHFEEAFEREDYPAARAVYDLLDSTVKRAKEPRLNELKEIYQKELAPDQERIQTILDEAQKVADQDRNDPTWAKQAAAALEDLQTAAELIGKWQRRTGEAAWARRQQRLQGLRDELTSRRNNLEDARQAYKRSREQLLERLWPLLFRTSLSGATPEAESALDSELSLPDTFRSNSLELMRIACSDLLRVFPDDPRQEQWRRWRDEADRALAALTLEARPPVELPSEKPVPEKVRPHEVTPPARWPQNIKDIVLNPAVLRAATGVTVALFIIAAIVVLARSYGPVVVTMLGGTGTPTATVAVPLPTESSMPTLTVSPTDIIVGATAMREPTLTRTPSPSPTTRVMASPSPTDTPKSPTATPTPAPLSFPLPGERLPVMPWQVDVTSRKPANVSLLLTRLDPPFTQPITVTLGDAQVPITTTLKLADTLEKKTADVGSLYRWTREVDDLRELPDGTYLLKALLDTDDDGNADEERSSVLVLERSLAQPATFRALDAYGKKRRAQPDPGSDSLEVISDKTPVRVFGLFERVTSDGQVAQEDSTERQYNARWCLCEAEENQPRFWVWCDFIMNSDGKYMTDPPFAVPLIAQKQLAP